jgi:adenosylcobyric acid synthase
MIPDLRIAGEDAVVLETAPAGGQLDSLDIAVVHLPHIANFDEFDALAAEPGVQVRYIQDTDELASPHAIILPGTKTTLSDLRWLRARGLEVAIRNAFALGTHVVGVCGGYQMLGEVLEDPGGAESAPGDQETGLSLLPVRTVFLPGKHTYQSQLRLPGGITVSGYEIHAGETTRLEGADLLGEIIRRNGEDVSLEEGAVANQGRVWGCYLHGIFENDAFRQTWLVSLGWRMPDTIHSAAMREAEYERLADIVEASVDWLRIEAIIGL